MRTYKRSWYGFLELLKERGDRKIMCKLRWLLYRQTLTEEETNLENRLWSELLDSVTPRAI